MAAPKETTLRVVLGKPSASAALGTNPRVKKVRLQPWNVDP